MRGRRARDRAGEVEGAPEPPPLPHPSVPPREGKRAGRQEAPLPPKFVSELGWSVDGAARAPLSGPGSEVPVPASAGTVSRPPGPAAVCGDEGAAVPSGLVQRRGKPSQWKRVLTGPAAQVEKIFIKKLAKTHYEATRARV